MWQAVFLKEHTSLLYKVYVDLDGTPDREILYKSGAIVCLYDFRHPRLQPFGNPQVCLSRTAEGSGSVWLAGSCIPHASHFIWHQKYRQLVPSVPKDVSSWPDVPEHTEAEEKKEHEAHMRYEESSDEEILFI
eukprot:GEZU01013984.1.p2 GENE.GEZU01013984.1~~GEZU01013984.1.p2  ORF type:complete len:133 (+),score=13.03 GEZU01013984.1:532-930(+)